jgi:hypothetical protein
VVIFGSLLLIFAAIGLAVLGVVDGSNALLIGSIAASLLAAVGLVVGARQAAADAVGDVPPVPAEPAPVQRLAPVGVGAPAAAGTVYPSGSAGTAAQSTGAGTAGQPTTGPAATGVIPTGTVPTSGEPANGSTAAVGPTTAVAAQPPVGTIPAQAQPDAFPSVAASGPPPVDDLDELSADDNVDQYGTVRGHREPAERAFPDGDPIAVAADAIGPDDIDRADIDRADIDPDHLGGDDLGHGVLRSDGGTPGDPPGEPAVEPASRADRDRAAHLDSEVVVIDGHPRYHLADCLHLKAREGLESLPVAEAEELGFTPCSACAPLRTLLAD